MVKIVAEELILSYHQQPKNIIDFNQLIVFYIYDFHIIYISV